MIFKLSSFVISFQFVLRKNPLEKQEFTLVVIMTFFGNSPTIIIIS